jgi:hypothetical protein
MNKNMSKNNEAKVTEQTFAVAVQKLGAKYAAIVTMVRELQDNLNELIGVSRELLREKNAKILELQVPVKKELKKGLKENEEKKL